MNPSATDASDHPAARPPQPIKGTATAAALWNDSFASNATLPSPSALPMALLASGEQHLLPSPAVTPPNPLMDFPTTSLVLLWVHLVFFYQCYKRTPRQNITVSYHTIVQRKRFYRLWLALWSHPPMERGTEERRTPADAAAAVTSPSASTSSVVMGGLSDPPRSDVWQPQPRIVQAVVAWALRQWKLVTQGPLSGAPLLVYNTHILWSCRALEEVSTHSGDPWTYARSLVALISLAVTLELLLTHALVRAIDRRQPASASYAPLVAQDIQPFDDGTSSSLDPMMLHQLRQRVQSRAIASLTALTAATLVVFHFRYINRPLAVLPWGADRFLWWLGRLHTPHSPALTYCLCMGILFLLARTVHPMGVVTGALSGLAWSVWGWDFLGQVYYGRWLLFVLVLLTVLSAQADYPRWCPCIDHVLWYEGGGDDGGTDENLQHRSWCWQPVGDPRSDQEEEEEEHRTEDVEDRDAEPASWLEFTRVRSESDGAAAGASVDPDLVEQGRRPRRTRIQSQRP